MSNFCQKLAIQFYKWNIIDCEEDINPLRFSFELIITQFMTYSTMIILGIMFHKFYETIIYLLLFTFLRRHIQGYHAETFHMCYILTILNYLVVMGMLKIGLPYYYLNILIYIFVFTFFKENEKTLINKMTLYYTLLIIICFFFNKAYIINMSTLIYSFVLFMRVIGGNDNANSDS